MDVYTAPQDRGERFDTELTVFLETISEKRSLGEIPDIEVAEMMEADAAMEERGNEFVELFQSRLKDEYSIRGYAEVTMSDQVGKRKLEILKPMWKKETASCRQIILNMPDWSRPFTFDFLMQRIDLLANLNFDSFSHLRQRLTKIFTVFSTTKRQRMHMDALETIQTYANLLNQSLNFNPLTEIKRLRDQAISEVMEKEWRDLSRQVRGSSSQIATMRKRYRQQYTSMWDEGLQGFETSHIVVQRIACTEIKKNFSNLTAAMKTEKLAIALKEILSTVGEFREKAETSMTQLETPEVGGTAQTTFGFAQIREMGEDGIFVCKHPLGVVYVPKESCKMEHAVTLRTMKLALEMASVVHLMQMAPPADNAEASELGTHNSKVQLVSMSEPVMEKKVSGGHSLRAVPDDTAEAPASSGPLSPGELEATELKLDGSKKALMIQLLLPKQRPQRVKLNESHTILQLYQHVKFLTNVAVKFQLLNQGTQPPTQLLDAHQTVGDANLNRVRVKMEILP